MHAGDSSLICSCDRSGELVARVRVPLAPARRRTRPARRRRRTGASAALRRPGRRRRRAGQPGRLLSIAASGTRAPLPAHEAARPGHRRAEPVPRRPGCLGPRGHTHAEPAHRQHHQHRPPAGRAIGHDPRVPAMNPRGQRTACRAPRLRRPAGRPDHHRVPGVLHTPGPQPAKVREQHEQQLFALTRDFQDTTGGGRRPGRRHGRLKRQRGSRAKRSWQVPASYRSLVAGSRRHAGRIPDRHISRNQPPVLTRPPHRP